MFLCVHVSAHWAQPRLADARSRRRADHPGSSIASAALGSSHRCFSLCCCFCCFFQTQVFSFIFFLLAKLKALRGSQENQQRPGLTGFRGKQLNCLNDEFIRHMYSVLQLTWRLSSFQLENITFKHKVNIILSDKGKRINRVHDLHPVKVRGAEHAACS